MDPAGSTQIGGVYDHEGTLVQWGDQYRQVFDAIVRLNGWDDAMVALQLLSHLEGDALNVHCRSPELCPAATS